MRTEDRSTERGTVSWLVRRTDLVDRSDRFVILRHATDDDEALHSFDVGDTSIPWLAEVAEIVAGLLGWRSDPVARPVLERRAQLYSERSDLVRDVREFRTWRRQINAYYPTPEFAEARLEALVTWKHWADGHPIAADRLATTADTLCRPGTPHRVLTG